jgi:hypothetical protein
VNRSYIRKCWLNYLGQVDKLWPIPINVHDPSFDFESAMASSNEREEMFGYLDSGAIGSGLFSDSPLTTPEPTPPPSPTQKPTFLDRHNPPPLLMHFTQDRQSAPRGTTSTSAGQFDKVGSEGKKYGSNKKRGHAKRKRDRAEQRKEREAGVQSYEVRPASRKKHVHGSKAADAQLELADIPISAPGYVGLRDTQELKDRTAYRLDDLVGENSRFKFKLQKWDGG